jgi:ribosomal protein S18 acetylase RimI-like enzyme
MIQGTGLKYKVVVAEPRDEALIKACAKFSEFTRDFNNPPMSLKLMRKEAFPNKEVYAAVMPGRARAILGFCWSRPMKPKHMPFSTVYYIGVLPDAKGQGVATALMEYALEHAKNGRIELVTEHRNVDAMAFFEGFGGEPIAQGTVGKDNRPYTRWAFERRGDA